MSTTTAQSRFDSLYITSREICTRLDVSRMALSKAGAEHKLPLPIKIDNTIMFLWEREEVEPYLQRWEQQLKDRRNK